MYEMFIKFFGRRARIIESPHYYTENGIDKVIYHRVSNLRRLGLVQIWYYKTYHSVIRALYDIYTPSFKFRMNHFGVCDTEIDGVDSSDYPKFCDAYYASAVWNDTMKNLDEHELDALTECSDTSQDAFEALL